MMTVPVNTSTPYRIRIERGLLTNRQWIESINGHNKRVVIITDTHVATLYANTLAKSLEAPLLTFAAGEQHKTRTTKATLEDQLLQQHFGRDTLIVAVGGGVVTDLAGFIAATYCRGVDIMYIPTTLLGMVDAAVGGKTAVNTAFGKNLIGAFKQPQAVYIDPEVLHTLTATQMSEGLIEAAKHGLIQNAELFHDIHRYHHQIINHEHPEIEPLLARIINIKGEIVAADETEQGIRAILNLGHTVAHGIEKHTQYTTTHGVAVGHGILIEAKMAQDLNILNSDDFNIIQQWHTTTCSQPLLMTHNDIPSIMEAMILDKKSQQKAPRFVFLEKIGKTHYRHHTHAHGADKQTILSALQWFIEHEKDYANCRPL